MAAYSPVPDSIETILAFDYGAKNIGVAVGQTLSRTAEPLTVVSQKHGKIDWVSIGKLFDEWRPDRVVVGFPNTRDGESLPIHAAIKRFVVRLEQRFELPVTLFDERLSSFEAAQQSHLDRHRLDAIAAQMILESWLNAEHQEKY